MSSRITALALFPLVLSCANSFAAADAIPENMGDRYGAANKLITEAFIDVYTRESPRWRAVAILKRCDKEGLSRVVEERGRLLKDEIGDAILRAINNSKLTYSSLENEDILIVHGAVASSVVGYQLGFDRGAGLAFVDKITKEALCEAALKNVEKFLK